MSRKKGIPVRLPALLMSVVLIFGYCMNAAAEEGAQDLDFNRKGTISVSLIDEMGEAMDNGTLSLYQVAVLDLNDGDMAYTYTEAFSGCGEEITQENLESSALLAQKLADWAKSTEAAALAEGQIRNGAVSFSDLSLGLYLVVQTVQTEGFYLIDPFLVTLPYLEDGRWIYDVDGSPKAEINPKGEPESQTESESEKETASSKTAEPGSGAPAGGSSGEEDTAVETLPQTGQLYWPIPFLAGGGFLLFIIGTVMVFYDRRKKNHAE